MKRGWQRNLLFLSIGFFLSMGSFSFCLAESQANQLYFNEIMANPQGNDEGREWVEVFNNSDLAIDLTGWKFNDGANHLFNKFPPDDEEATLIIGAGEWAVLVDDPALFLVDYPNFSGLIIDTVLSLSNSGSQLKLIDPEEGIHAEVGYSGNIANNNGKSIEFDGEGWFESLVPGGTPGQINSLLTDTLPASPTLLSPTENQILAIPLPTFSWSFDFSSHQFPIFFIIEISPTQDFSQIIQTIQSAVGVTEITLTKPLEEGNYYWRIKATDGYLDSEWVETGPFTFVLPTYSDQIVISELFPDPPSPLSDEKDEWFELANLSSKLIDLSNWQVCDLLGESACFIIPLSTFIQPNGFLIFYRENSKITLNNDGDGLKLIAPNGQQKYLTPIYINVVKGLAWALNDQGDFVWTTVPTPGSKNIIQAPPKDEESSKNQNVTNLGINEIPQRINTNQANQFSGQLVEVIGTVVETSGQTFYLDDGSGRIKIYLQEKAGIKKPKMKKGYLVRAVGRVNFYRGSWRILPQKQEDIEILSTFVEGTQQTSTQSSSSKNKQAGLSSAVEKVLAAEENVPSLSEDNLAADSLAGGDQPKEINLEKRFWYQFGYVLLVIGGAILIFWLIRFIILTKWKK